MELSIGSNQTTKRTAQIAASSVKNRNIQSSPRNQSIALDHSPGISNGDGDVDGVRSPFQREVREWQRVDPTTGALLTGRLEADRWINGPLNSYGKISDSQNIAQPDGTRRSQRKQLEVLQQRTASGGAVQVIRAQTVQRSSSRWSSSPPSASTAILSTKTKTKCISNTNNENDLRNDLSNGKLNNNNDSDNIHNRKSRSQPLAPRIDFSAITSPTKNNILNNANNIYDDDDCNVDDGSNDDDDCNDNDCIIVTGKESSARENNTSASDFEKCLLNDHGYYLDEEKPKQHDQITNNNNNNITDNCIKKQYISSPIGNSNNISNNLNNFLLLATTPSLKLSNLMKSSSSISSNSNSSYAAATTSTDTTNSVHSRNSNNRHCRGEDKSHPRIAIVGNMAAATLSTSTSSASMKVTPANLLCQQRANPRNSRLYDHQRHPTFDEINSSSCCSFTKSNVGGSSSVYNGDDYSNNDVADYGLHELVRRTRFLNSTDDGNLPPTQLHRLQQKDLESFRLRNNNHLDDHAKYIDHDDDDDDGNNNTEQCDCSTAVNLRISSNHQQHQLKQNPSPDFLNLPLQLGRSISTDDLYTDCGLNLENKEPELSNDWSRISKLRRSFQSTSTTAREKTDELSQAANMSRRPPDLPESSVSVAKMRAELEKKRRLTAAMSRVDLAALQNLIGNSKYRKPSPDKHTNTITAETLKEIRGRLKKVSNESPYKDNFVAPVNPEQIDMREDMHNSAAEKLLLPKNNVALKTTPHSAFTVFSPQKHSAVEYNNTQKPHNTNSLESKQKGRDTTSDEWHRRRKSYGFEKMSPPANNSMFRMDASTDSGLGRSGELGAWSPTENASGCRGTIIHFGEGLSMNGGVLQNRAHQEKLNTPPDGELAEDIAKRHSVAVSQTEYHRKTSHVLLKPFEYHPKHSSHQQHVKSKDTDSSTNAISTQHHSQRTQQKRVEFCKTEVHFAAESGRVNIVETDGKPPPTNNFRRRRRATNGHIQNIDDSFDAAAASTLHTEIPVAQCGEDILDTSEAIDKPQGITVSLNKTDSRSSFTSANSSIDTADNDNDEMVNIRGILKNKPVKPKPYHLGENFNSAHSLWGMVLKPGTTSSPTGIPTEEPLNSSAIEDATPSLFSNKSVAERIRSVERLQEFNSLAQAKSYSTKINVKFSDNNTDWKEKEKHFPKTGPSFRRASAQELILNELKEHQKILDEGLKSTSLIIRTMRSANEFDEAMRRLSIASNEAGGKYTALVVSKPILKSNNCRETFLEDRRCSHTSLINERPHNINHSRSCFPSIETTKETITDSCRISLKPPKLAPHRFKLIGNAVAPVSKHISKPRRLHEMTAKHEDELGDSADEEVRRYFIRDHMKNSETDGRSQESSSLEDTHTFEYSSNWSHLNAKHTVWQFKAAKEIKPNSSHNHMTPIKTKELPHSNVMKIELRSPQQATLNRTRWFAPEQHLKNNTSKHEHKDSLRIIKEARGARNLREHELCYFGVSLTKAEPTAIGGTTSNSKRTLPNRSQLKAETNQSAEDIKRDETHHSKFSLNNSRKEYMHFSPTLEELQVPKSSTIVRSTELLPRAQDSIAKAKLLDALKKHSYQEKADVDIHSDENSATDTRSVKKVKPHPSKSEAQGYKRKKDLKRNKRILSELTETAEQIMKALSEEAALKDKARRPTTHLSAHPLETIKEKSNSEKGERSGVSLTLSRSNVASEDKRNNDLRILLSPTAISQSSRSSSQSSVESYSRSYARSLSSVHHYENVKQMPAAKTTHMRYIKTPRSLNSSGDEQYRGEKHLQAKTKRQSSSGALLKVQQQEGIRHVNETSTLKCEPKDHDGRSLRISGAHKHKTASTARSTQRERAECIAESIKSQHTLSRRSTTDYLKRSTSNRLSTVGKPELPSSGRIMVTTKSSHGHGSAHRPSKRTEDPSGTEKEKWSRSKDSHLTYRRDHTHQQHLSSASKVRPMHGKEDGVKNKCGTADTAVSTPETQNGSSLSGSYRRHDVITINKQPQDSQRDQRQKLLKHLLN